MSITSYLLQTEHKTSPSFPPSGINPLDRIKAYQRRAPRREQSRVCRVTPRCYQRGSQSCAGIRGQHSSLEVRQESALCSENPLPFSRLVNPGAQSQRCRAQLQAWLFAAPSDCNYRRTPLIGFAAAARGATHTGHFSSSHSALVISLSLSPRGGRALC